MITVEHANKELEIKVHEGAFGGIHVKQGDDLIFVYTDNIKLFVAAVRAVATDILGEEV